MTVLRNPSGKGRPVSIPVEGLRFVLRFKLYRSAGNSAGYIRVDIGNRTAIVNVSDYPVSTWTAVELRFEPSAHSAPWYLSPRFSALYTNPIAGGTVLVSDIEVSQQSDALVTWQKSQSAAYAITLNDVGQRISITTGGVTLGAAVAEMPVGAWFEVYNASGSAQNITYAGTLRLAGTATTGTRTLAGYGLAVLNKVGASEWVVSGAGVT